MTRLAAHPFITAVGSMMLATMSYAALFGWRFAVAIIVVLLIHELGHVAAGRLLRLPLKALVFIPFIGAFVTFKEETRIVEQDAVLALGGPAGGAVFAFACGVAALCTGNADLGLLGRIGALLNMFQLIPLPMLDGGRILAIVSPRLCVLGVPIWGGLLWRHVSYDMVLVAVIALPLVFEGLRGDRGDRDTIAFYAAPPAQRVWAVAAYAVTAAVLAMSLVMGEAARG